MGSDSADGEIILCHASPPWPVVKCRSCPGKAQALSILATILRPATYRFREPLYGGLARRKRRFRYACSYIVD